MIDTHIERKSKENIYMCVCETVNVLCTVWERDGEKDKNIKRSREYQEDI